MPKPPLLEIRDLRGGRNGADPPLSLSETQCVEALNVDWYDGMIARKRNGATAVTETGGTAFSSGIQKLFRHVPGASLSAAEFWGIDGAATPIVKRMTGGTSFADVTLSDAIATAPQQAVAASLNGKLFLAYDSTVDRLHVYDPLLATPAIRRVGFATPGAPTAANTGAGAYAAVLRYYRVRWLQLSGTTVVRRSEAGSSLSFTPSGTGTGVIVTRPTAASESETHWEIEASTDNATFYRLSQIAIATTTYTDSAATTTYANNTLSDATGFHSRFPSVKYLVTDGNRVLGAGAWESSGADSGGKNSRIWFTPVLGSSDKGDDERVPNQTTQKNWVDLNENDGGFITGLSAPVNGVPYAFKYRQVWKLIPTGDVTIPYLPRKLRDDIGAIAHDGIVLGEDAQGHPALYFVSHKGPYRVTTGGRIQYLGRDIEDIWATVNLAATSVVCHGIYHADKHQVWFWVATGSSNSPDTKLVFDVLLGQAASENRVRGGWAKHTSASAAAQCSCMMSNTLGATMSNDLKPYIGRSSGTVIWKCDSSATNDAGTNFQAYVQSRPLLIAPIGQFVGLGQSLLVAKVAAGVTITQTLDRDFSVETRTSSVLLTASASESRVVKKFEASEMAQANTIQVQLGDAAAASNQWTLDAWAAPVHSQDRF